MQWRNTSLLFTVYSDARWSKGKTGSEIEFVVQPRKNSKPICAGCGKRRPGYDRRFEYVPLWASGKNHQTNSYRLFLARWAKRMSWQEVAKVFGTNWDSVYRAV